MSNYKIIKDSRKKLFDWWYRLVNLNTPEQRTHNKWWTCQPYVFKKYPSRWQPFVKFWLESARLNMRSIIVFSVFLLSSCTTLNYVPKNYNGKDISTIQNIEIRGPTDWKRFSIASIDGNNVVYGIGDKDSTTLIIASGKRNVKAYVTYNNIKTYDDNCPCEASAQLSFFAEPDVSYRLVGKVKHPSVEFWIVNQDTGERVSQKASTTSQAQPKETIVPIFVPL
jgi:hypothetical protein